MKITQQFCYTHPSGEDIYLFALRNNHGTEVRVSNYGAIIQSFLVMKKDGVLQDIVLGFDTMEEYTAKSYVNAYPWFGAAIGRYANRIKDAQFSLEGIHYSVTKNDHGNQLHGGNEGFDKKIWGLVSHSAQELVLRYSSPDGEEGFPGNLEVTITFQLTDNNELHYTYAATTDKLTIVNLTHHSYFNLGDPAHTIHQHLIRIPASHYLEQDSTSVSTGKMIAVANTVFDFTQWKKAHQPGQDTGFDHCFVTDKNETDLALCGEIAYPPTGLKLAVWSTAPAVHFYTGKYIPSLSGKAGVTYQEFGGLCLETEVHPNAVNIPHFPNTELRPGELYQQKTIYKVTVEDSK